MRIDAVDALVVDVPLREPVRGVHGITTVQRSVLARVLSWALDRGIVAANPCTHGGRLYRGSRAERISRSVRASPWTPPSSAL